MELPGGGSSLPSHDRASSNAFSRGTFTSGGAGVTLELALKCMWRLAKGGQKPPLRISHSVRLLQSSAQQNTHVYFLNRVSQSVPISTASVSYFTVPPRAHPSTGSQSGSATPGISVYGLSSFIQHALLARTSKKQSCRSSISTKPPVMPPVGTYLRFAHNLAVCFGSTCVSQLQIQHTAAHTAHRTRIASMRHLMRASPGAGTPIHLRPCLCTLLHAVARREPRRGPWLIARPQHPVV